MYNEGMVSLETKEDKEKFLVEFGFWFPGESEQLVHYKDFGMFVPFPLTHPLLPLALILI